MKKQMKYCLIICCIIPSILAACYHKPDHRATELNYTDAESNAETRSETNTELQSAVSSDMDQETNPQELPDYLLPDADSRLYSQKELELLSAEQIKLARNEIYARHGRKFRDPALDTYFQSKPWYQGTIEPDSFDDSQLNQTEHNNLTLLLRLEREKRNGRIGYPTAPYAETFAAWDNGHETQKVSQKLYADGNGTVVTSEDSTVIAHDLYYEITNCQVFVDDVYDRSLLDAKQEGDRVTLNGNDYIITAIETGTDHFRNCVLTYVTSAEDSPAASAQYILLKECREGFYEKMDNDYCGPNKLIYEGSLYFYRDARIETGMMEGQKTITAQEYFETPRSKQINYDSIEILRYPRAGGLQENGHVQLMGIPTYDEYYYFTGFTEVSRNWIG